MALVQYAGVDVLAGRLHMPLRGVWWCELKLDTVNPPTGQNQLTSAGGMTLTGTVIKSGVFLGQSRVRVVGGAGGMTKTLAPTAYQNALVRDPLNAILGAGGEVASSAIVQSMLSLPLSYWTITSESAAHALDNLVGAVGRQLNQSLNWRVNADGSIWLGAETWPQQSLPADADVLFVYPLGPRFEIGAAYPNLIPGVFLTDVSANLSGVSIWIRHDHIREWAWT